MKIFWSQMKRSNNRILWMTLFLGSVLFTGIQASAQLDQGAITGVVQDKTGAVIPDASVTLTSTDTGLVLQTKSDSSGIYNFSPIKMGNFTVSASSPGFQTTIQLHVHLDVQQRLNVVLVLAPGMVSQTVTVSTAPSLLQTQQGSVGQVVSTRTINNTPLNGRNWVYIAQLTAGVTPSIGSRGAGTGDFIANGQRATQNNFILDGIDNNVNVIDFMNGASYLILPPPDALAEFKIDTSSFSAEFGHSAGAVMNASIKSGTNQIHGDLWEYFRNDALDARDFDALTIPKYRENQFGATLGFPIIPNKLFLFGDAQANRIIFGNTATFSVPTPLMRQGNFTELLNTSLTGGAKPGILYQPNSGGTALLACNGAQNVFCGPQIDKVAQNILNLYPVPNANGGRTYNNRTENLNNVNNTFQWDVRSDWNISSKDQTYARFSYDHVVGSVPPPLGPILNGSFGFASGTISTINESFMGSETHIFNPNLTNELRFGYNYGDFSFLQLGYNSNSLAAGLGLGGTPPVNSGGYKFNGGLPLGIVDGISRWGSPNDDPSIEHMNTYQILDNVTKIAGNHSLKFGIDLQSIRSAALQPTFPRGFYIFNGLYTSNLGRSFTGSGVADFLADQQVHSALSTELDSMIINWYRSAYAEDNWRINTKLTVNLGLRYDYYQPYKEEGGRLANFYPTGAPGPGTGSGVFVLPQGNLAKYPLSPAFLQILSKDHITVQSDSNQRLVTGQHLNFAPRLGFAYSVTPKTVAFGGFGIFYGGLENIGGQNLSDNYPYQFTSSFTPPNCAPNDCPSDGITLEQGFTKQVAAGLGNDVTFPQLTGSVPQTQTPYTVDYDLTFQQALSSNLVASLGYVGNESRHLVTGDDDPNAPAALINPANNPQFVQPFPDLGFLQFVSYHGVSTYNSLQTKLEKRFTDGLNFLATYTWSHSMNDAPPPLGSDTFQYRNPILIPIIKDYANALSDVRNRVTFNGYYELPFGKGHPHLNRGGIVDALAGGWATNITFVAQSGSPFTVYPNIRTAAGGSAHAILVRDPFAPGGSPDPSNPTITCAAHTRNLHNWYNPCAFANPLAGSSIPRTGSGSQVTSYTQALRYLGPPRNQITGPGYEQVSMSIFKNFTTYRGQYMQFRADIFNVLNTPDYGNPSVPNDNTNGGQITGARFLQNFTPDARFFQLALKYVF